MGRRGTIEAQCGGEGTYCNRVCHSANDEFQNQLTGRPLLLCRSITRCSFFFLLTTMLALFSHSHMMPTSARQSTGISLYTGHKGAPRQKPASEFELHACDHSIAFRSDRNAAATAVSTTLLVSAPARLIPRPPSQSRSQWCRIEPDDTARINTGTLCCSPSGSPPGPGPCAPRGTPSR